MPVAKGDKVMFAQYSGADVVLEGAKYKVVSATNCIAKW
jgi:co-chaperonin GroES (HSP10)